MVVKEDLINKKLDYLKSFNVPHKQKIRLINNLYKLANIQFNEYLKNWHNSK